MMQGTNSTPSTLTSTQEEQAVSIKPPQVLRFSERRDSFDDSPRIRKKSEGVDIVLAIEEKKKEDPDKGEFHLVKKKSLVNLK